MQRKFSFRLGRVLRVRAIEESVARAEWGAAQAELLGAEAKRDARSQQLAAAREELAAGRATGEITPDQVTLVDRAVDAQVFGLTNAIEQVHGKLVSAEQANQAWRQRERDRRALAELEDRARTKHRVDLEAQQNLELDEQAIGRTTRKRQSQREAASSPKESEIYSRSKESLPKKSTRY